jgi:hypothetical protein
LEKERSAILNDWWWVITPPIITAIAVGLLAYMFFKITAKALYRRLVGNWRKEAKIDNNLMVRKGEKQ